MKKHLLYISMFVMIMVIAVIDLLGITGILSQDVTIPLMFPFVILMFCLFVLILKGEKKHENGDR